MKCMERFFNLMFSAFFHRINIIMNEFARLNVAFFLLNELGLFSIISISGGSEALKIVECHISGYSTIVFRIPF